MTELKLGSLFDGIGGFPLAATMNDIRPVWASEIEPFPMAVTAYRFPQMKHMGDITKLHGANLPVVDVIAGGSPCQDLSVAGKREGLAGERSGLFMEQVRIVKEMRKQDRRRMISVSFCRSSSRSTRRCSINRESSSPTRIAKAKRISTLIIVHLKNKHMRALEKSWALLFESLAWAVRWVRFPHDSQPGQRA